MARSNLACRTVLEPLSTFDLATHSGGTSIRSLAVSSLSQSDSDSDSDSQTLIYIGTHSGSLILLSASPNPNPNTDDDGDSVTKRSVSFLRSVSLGDSPVETVLILAGIAKVLVLCDGCLFLVDSLLAQPVKRFTLFRGVSVISRRITTSESESSRLSTVSTSGLESSGASQRFFRKLGGGIKVNGTKTRETEALQSQGNDNHFAVVIAKRLILTELRFGNNRLGKIDDAVNGSLVLLKEMQCIDGVKTMVWLNDSIILGTAHGYSLFSCFTGQSGVIFTLPDESSPPLLKLLGKEKVVLLLVDNVGIVVSEHGQPIGGSFIFRSCPDSVAELSSHMVLVRDGHMELYHKRTSSCIQTVVFGGKGVGPSAVANEENGNGKIIAVATSTKVICYRNVPSEEQIKDLLRKKSFKEAISLVEELECEGEMSKEMLSFVHAQVGFLLLFGLHFEEAVNHFLQSETMQPSEIFPFIMRDPNRWSLLVPRKRYWGLHPPPTPIEDIVDDGLITIQRAIFLRKAGVDSPVDDDFLLNPPTRAGLIELAIKNMIRYLEVSRQKQLTLLMREGVDTLLMYLYRALNRVHDMEKLASSENCCIVRLLSEACLKDDCTTSMGSAGGVGNSIR
uniref:CNH domain-containing protein n=1 Tax=Rhizophora mucronata TaxID=61149 RepID=A0A2P2LMP1_RHIMU